MFHVKHPCLAAEHMLPDVSRETFYFNGSLEGKPAFLGYFPEVSLFL